MTIEQTRSAVDLETFLALDDRAVAEYVRERGTACWAVAVGGTRRAYIAQGGRLDRPADYPVYIEWLDHQDTVLLDQLFRLGVQTVVRVMRFPRDRGQEYAKLAGRALSELMTSASRRELHARHDLAVSIVAHAAPGECRTPPLLTTSGRGPRLVYLLRGDWVAAGAEEAAIGYDLGRSLGRAPTLSELTNAFYGMDVPPLSVYVGSGRPRVANLLPPFIRGEEDLYWSQTPLLTLSGKEWRRIIFDHLWSRRTHSARGYELADAERAYLGESLRGEQGHLLGVGGRHRLGYWTAEHFPAAGTRA